MNWEKPLSFKRDEKTRFILKNVSKENTYITYNHIKTMQIIITVCVCIHTYIQEQHTLRIRIHIIPFFC